jgi:hypothetical protein
VTSCLLQATTVADWGTSPRIDCVSVCASHPVEAPPATCPGTQSLQERRKRHVSRGHVGGRLAHAAASREAQHVHHGREKAWSTVYKHSGHVISTVPQKGCSLRGRLVALLFQTGGLPHSDSERPRTGAVVLAGHGVGGPWQGCRCPPHRNREEHAGGRNVVRWQFAVSKLTSKLEFKLPRVPRASGQGVRQASVIFRNLERAKGLVPSRAQRERPLCGSATLLSPSMPRARLQPKFMLSSLFRDRLLHSGMACGAQNTPQRYGTVWKRQTCGFAARRHPVIIRCFSPSLPVLLFCIVRGPETSFYPFSFSPIFYLYEPLIVPTDQRGRPLSLVARMQLTSALLLGLLSFSDVASCEPRHYAVSQKPVWSAPEESNRGQTPL